MSSIKAPTRGRRRRAASFAVAGLAAYTLVVSLLVVGCGLADRLLLFPTRHPIDPGGAGRLVLPSAGGAVEVWRSRSPQVGPEGPAAFVLRFYGNADRPERWVAGEAAALPFPAEVWGVSYPGFGGSAGRATLRGVAASARVAYDALRARAAGRPIVVIGTSMGTAAALRVAARREVAALVLHNPPPLRAVILGDHGWWNLWLLAYPVSFGVPRALDSIANAARARAPAIFVMAEHDEVVRLRYQLRVRDAYAGPKESLLLPGARHNDPIPAATREHIHRRLAEWVARRP